MRSLRTNNRTSYRLDLSCNLAISINKKASASTLAFFVIDAAYFNAAL